MLSKLLLLFIVVPILELILLIQIGQWVGTLPTIALIIFTGILGAFLVKRQGVRALTRINSQVQAGQLPADAIFDGAIILVAGAFLMTPGILTDTMGFLCLIPSTRRVIKRFIASRFKKMVQNGQVFVGPMNIGGMGANPEPKRYTPPEDVIIIDHDDYA